MFKGSRLLIVSLVVLVSFIFVDTDKASAVVDPFTGYIVVSAVLHAVVIGGAVAYKYFSRENGGAPSANSHKIVASTGTVGREASVTWVSLTSDGQVQQNYKNVSAKASFSDVTTLANTTQYPNIKAAIDNSKRSYVLATEDSGWDVGNVYYDGNAYYQWTSKDPVQTYTSGSAVSSTGIVQFNSFLQKYYATHTFAGTNGYTRQTFYGIRLGTSPPAPLSVPDRSKFVKQLDTNSDGNIESVFKGEIDDFIKSNPNVVHYADTADPALVDSASDFVGPSTPSASDLASASSKLASADATRNAWLNYSSNKGDSVAKQIWLDRVAQDAKDVEKDVDIPALLSSPGDVPDLDFSRFQDLKGALSSTYPFSLIGSLPDLLSPFSRSPVAPVIHLPVYGNDLVVDLSMFDPVAAVCRWCIGLLATAGVVYYIVHFWRGVS